MKFQVGLTAFLLAFSLTAGAGQKQMSVQVEDAKVRASATALGAVAGTLRYGDRVAVLDSKGSWLQIQTTDLSLTGWVHQSALVKGEVKMERGDKKAESTASSDEMAAATKGFNSKVEAEFKAKNSEIDFSWVDKMEGYGIADDILLDFIKAGGLTLEEGAAK